MSRRFTQRYLGPTFALITLLVLAQVSWWVVVFLRDAREIAALEMSQVNPKSMQAIAETHRQRQRMVLSEASFFATLTCLGLYLLFRALSKEKRSRDTQRSFIEVFSHESRTPLTALKLRLESLREKSGDAAEREGLSLALDEVRRLSGVFEKAMSLNRTESLALKFESVPLAEVVESVLQRLDPWLAARGVQIEQALDPRCYVEGDFSSLENSVQSLLENAVLYNPSADRRVRVEVFERASRACIRLSDNGPGIPLGEENQLFDRFYRGSAGRSVPGTGLGLYLAHSVVQAHRGMLRLVRCEVGACFEIDLPQARFA